MAFRRLLTYLAPYRGQVIAILGVMGGSAIIGLLPPILMRRAVDESLAQGDLLGLWWVCLAILLLGLVEGILRFSQQYFSQLVGQKAIRDLRVQLFNHASLLSFTYYDKAHAGDLTSRIVSDTDDLRRFLTMGLTNFIINIATLVGILVILLSWAVELFVVFVFLFPMILASMVMYTKRVNPANRRVRAATGWLSASIEECLAGIREVKLYGREAYMGGIFDGWNKDYYEAVVESGRHGAIWLPIVPFLVSLGSGLVLLVGGILAANDTISIGTLLAATAYFATLNRPLRMLTRFLHISNRAQASGDRIFEILDTTPGIVDQPSAIPMENVRGKVEYRGVSFEYEVGHKILDEVTLCVPPGQVLALVGPSGVGKTTLLHLLPRFYEPQEGVVLIDGQNVRDLTLDSLRRQVGIVMQETFLFDGTIRDNIIFGHPEATPRVIEDAIRVTQLDSFVQALPEGLDTPVGERGVRLSGGQAQRLSLARVLVTDPKLLILDEPTANVDAVTDERVMVAVRNTMRGRTTLVIAHRLWTVLKADQIAVLRDGRIEAVGSHETLVKSCPFYTELFATHFLVDKQTPQLLPEQVPLETSDPDEMAPAVRPRGKDEGRLDST